MQRSIFLFFLYNCKFMFAFYLQNADFEKSAKALRFQKSVIIIEAVKDDVRPPAFAVRGGKVLRKIEVGVPEGYHTGRAVWEARARDAALLIPLGKRCQGESRDGLVKG